MERNSVGTKILMNTVKPEQHNNNNTIKQNKNSSKNLNQNNNDTMSLRISSNKETQQIISKPSSKLEHIEKFLLNTKSCEVCATTSVTNASKNKHKVGNLHNSSGIINTVTHNAVLSSHNCCNKILNNLVLFDEPKIFSQRRSISEKLRNSFKNTTNNINLINNNNTNNNELINKEINGQLIVPRKWHSERCRASASVLNINSMIKPPSLRFSTQVPLSSHYKAILAQYTGKPKKEQAQLNEQDEAKSQTIKISNKNERRKKHFSYIIINKEQNSQTEMTTSDNHNKYAIKKNEWKQNNMMNEISSSSSLSDTDLEYENNLNFTTSSKKCKSKIRKYQRPRAYQNDADSADTDTDLENNEIEAENFDYNSRVDFIRDRIMSGNNVNEIDLELIETEANASLATSGLNDMKFFYENVMIVKNECVICCETLFLNERKCCKFQACNNCINTYIQTQIKQSCGSISIECLNNKCNRLMNRDEISERMIRFDNEALKMYIKFLSEANKDSNCKTCPRCSHSMTIINSKQNKKQHDRKKLKYKNLLTKVQCNRCQLVWCFQCHAPWHDGITCGEFRKGDRMLRYWAKEVHYGQQNAQLCPKCKIYIQRTKGCDHMVCTFCHTDFCYKCGCKFRGYKFLGDHYSKLSVLGCKYLFYPEKPFKRRAIRSSILCGQVLAAPLVGTVALVAGAGAIVVGCIALPAYGSYKLINFIQKKNKHRNKLANEIVIVNPAAEKGLLITNPKQVIEETNQNSNESVENPCQSQTTANLIPREATTDPKLIEINSRNQHSNLPTIF